MVHVPTVAQVQVPEFLQETVSSIVAFVPRLVGALVILLIGWLVGIFAGMVVRRLVDAVELDRAVLQTPLGNILGGTESSVSGAFGKLTKWFVIALSLLAAANVLAIPLLSEWIQVAVSYLPAFIAGLAIIVVGFVIADFLGDAIGRTQAATETAYTSWFATGTRMFLYFTALVVGLETMGVDVGILYVFARALAWGIAAAVAIGAGVALGWGGHTYVENNIGRWMGRAQNVSPRERAQADGGPESTDD